LKQIVNFVPKLLAARRAEKKKKHFICLGIHSSSFASQRHKMKLIFGKLKDFVDGQSAQRFQTKGSDL
jgi:hypothetical protein